MLPRKIILYVVTSQNGSASITNGLVVQAILAKEKRRRIKGFEGIKS